jgi:hypothetical protein
MEENVKSERKLWQKPQLIVLVRNKPEEAVLLACKNGASPGPNSGSGTCWESCLEVLPS